jgi:hypothetical protein
MTKYEKGGDIIILILETIVIIAKNSKKLRKLITKKVSKIK